LTNKQGFRAALLVLGCLFGNLAAAAEPWSLARNSNGVKVWTRPVPSYPLREFRASTTVESTLGGLVNLILDTERAPQWIYRTERIDVLQRDDREATFLIRVITDFPWPLTDRDAVVAGRIFQEADGTVRIISQSLLDGQYPLDPAYLRMPDFFGDWSFRPVGSGKVEVTMTGRANPGGAIPHSVINLIIHETPYQTLRGLQRVIGEARYQSARFDMIREPGQGRAP